MSWYKEGQSRIKMVILTKNGCPNQTVYSPIDQNRKSDNYIINGMLRRWYAKDVMKTAQVIQFYDMNSNQLIKKIKAQ